MLVCVRLSNYATSHRVFQRHAGIAPVTDSALMQADRAIKPVQHQVPAELMHEQRVWVERMHLHTLGRPEPREDRVVARLHASLALASAKKRCQNSSSSGSHKLTFVNRFCWLVIGFACRRTDEFSGQTLAVQSRVKGIGRES
eukprot:CAMPEP_0181215596 /NCGR_PEP_ID=MMETSP1096-20121128/26100_1 /TAXON_ID=156174 ORGANISM="Chrysochromulina ericina, Strain CCMP281" /NCGR_SAMPLE_ID=MMETSP1096 /ASSEMBLY_ACC=CAM_ASM_000453 /LENGTH=142 /DNA_ID=CAMNT_0023307467 /DNA_START=422 /DNA_END=850 /DNA_ORIENTATION=-